MRAYKGRKQTFCRQVAGVIHDGIPVPRQDWCCLLKEVGGLRPGDLVYNPHTDDLSTVERVEVVRENFTNSRGSFVIEFWIHTEDGGVLSDPARTREQYMSRWGFCEDDLEYIKRWNRGEVPSSLGAAP